MKNVFVAGFVCVVFAGDNVDINRANMAAEVASRFADQSAQLREESTPYISVADEASGKSAELRASGDALRAEQQSLLAKIHSMMAEITQKTADMTEAKVKEAIAEPAKRLAEAHAFLKGWNHPANYEKKAVAVGAEPYLQAISTAVQRQGQYQTAAADAEQKAQWARQYGMEDNAAAWEKQAEEYNRVLIF